MGQRAALYCRVSTAEQSRERQERDLLSFTERAGYDVVAVFKETASGSKDDRVERGKVLTLVRARQIGVVLVTELTRWGRSTTDLLSTPQEQEVGFRSSPRPGCNSTCAHRRASCSRR